MKILKKITDYAPKSAMYSKMYTARENSAKL